MPKGEFYYLEVRAYKTGASEHYTVFHIELEGHEWSQAVRIAIRECKEARAMGHESVHYVLTTPLFPASHPVARGWVR